MIDVRAAVGAVTAWRILKRHPCYHEATRVGRRLDRCRRSSRR